MRNVDFSEKLDIFFPLHPRKKEPKLHQKVKVKHSKNTKCLLTIIRLCHPNDMQLQFLIQYCHNDKKHVHLFNCGKKRPREDLL